MTPVLVFSLLLAVARDVVAAESLNRHHEIRSPRAVAGQPHRRWPEEGKKTADGKDPNFCIVECGVKLPEVTVYEWESYIPTSTVTIETIVTVVNPIYPDITGVHVQANTDVPGDIPWIEDGTVISEVHIPRPTGEDIPRILTWPTVLTHPGTAMTAYGEFCWSEVLQNPHIENLAAWDPWSEEIDFPEAPDSTNYRLVANKRVADQNFYRSLYPENKLVNQMQFCSTVVDPAQFPDKTQLYGVAYVTASTTSTITGDCRPDKNCPPPSATPVSNGVAVTPTPGSSGAGRLTIMSPHTEKLDKPGGVLSGPTAKVSTAIQTGTALPVSENQPVVTVGTQIAPVRGSSFNLPGPFHPVPTEAVGFTLDPSHVIPLSIQQPAAGDSGASQTLVIVDGTSAVALDQIITVSNTPVKIAHAPTGTGLVAIVGAGTGDERSVDIGDIGTRPHENGPPVIAPIFAGGVSLTPEGDDGFRLSDGQELELNGPSVTVGAPGQRTTLGFVRGGGRNGVLVVNGVSSTLDVLTGTPAPGTVRGVAGKDGKGAATWPGGAGAVEVSWRIGVGLAAGVVGLLMI